MILRSLSLTTFRGHEHTTCTFAPSVNLLYGPNGAGKTNVLEAIHYVCLSKGFVASGDRYIVRHGAGHAEVEGLFARESRRDQRVRMVYLPGTGKRMFVNGVSLDRVSEIVGQLPVVVYAPQDHALTSGGPGMRRRFLDNLLSQASPLYLDNLLRFRRVLRQRNRYFSMQKGVRTLAEPEMLASWNEQLVEFGSKVVLERMRFVREFTGYLNRAYEAIESAAERPSIAYQTIARFPADVSMDAIRTAFRDRLAESMHEERRRAMTLTGPHLDELVFRLDGMLVRRYASQGQHRTFGLAMKIAMYFFLHERTGDLPILLLDDVFDHLDEHRTKAFLDLLESDLVGQVFITATGLRSFAGYVPFEEEKHQVLYVEQGQVHEVEAATREA